MVDRDVTLNTNTNPIRTRIFMFFAAIIFLGVGIGYYYYTNSRTLNMAKTEGIVVDLKPRRGSIVTYNRNAKYAPILEYTVNGKKYRTVSKLYFKGSFIYPKLHKKVTVYYNPENPNEVVMKGEFNVIIFGALILGGIIILVSLIFSILFPRK